MVLPHLTHCYILHQQGLRVEDGDEFPPPPPEALIGYAPVGKRCTSNEFKACQVDGGSQCRPSTTGLSQRYHTPAPLCKYPSYLSSAVTMSSNHEELAMAYHNSKVSAESDLSQK